MSTKNIKFNIIANEAKFKDFANPELVSENLKNYQQNPQPVKGYSKKTQDYKDSIVSEREKNYDGKWYEQGWVIDNKNNFVIDYSIITPMNFSYNDRYFRPINELPYSRSGSTGVYFNEIWSGYNNGDVRLPSGLQTGLRLCGFIDESFTGTYTEVMPYRNLFEFFDHKDNQVGDMGNRWFHSGEGRVKGEFIAKNNVYFLSGLGPQNLFDKNTEFLIFSNHIRNNETTSEGRQLPEPIAFYWYPERQNKTRFSIFVHTGNLNLIKVPVQYKEDPTFKQISAGNLYQYKNSKWGLDNYAVELTGIYPETLRKTFSIANTGNSVVEIYFSPEDLILNLDTVNKPSKSEYIWTNENIKIYKSGESISTITLGPKSNLNFDLSVITTGLFSSINTQVTKNLGFYQITGKQLVSGSAYKALYIQNTVPVKISSLSNNTKITADDYFFKSYISGLYSQSLLAYRNTSTKNTLIFTTGGLNFDTKFFGITYYSTGNNLNQTEVAQDLNKKIKRLDQFSNTGSFSGMKKIYPILSGESYLYVDSNVDWIVLDSNEKIFRWLSGVSGYFSSPNSFNPTTGALQVDVQIAIKPYNLLPISLNENGSNFNITFTGNKLGIINKSFPNNFILNTANTGYIKMPIALERGKSYRFLQTDSTDIANLDFGFSKLEDKKYFNYEVYEPEYNKINNKNYRLTTFTIPNDHTSPLLAFRANKNSTEWTGFFSIYLSTGISNTKKINDFSQTYTSSGEWFVFGFEPNIKDLEPKPGFLPFLEVYPSGSAKINPILNNLKLNNYKNGPYLNTTFYSNIENAVEVLNNYENNLSNPCYSISGKIDQQRRWWRLKVKNKDGSTTTGCYSSEEFIMLSSKVYSQKNPQIDVIPGERYNFVRTAMTNFEITGLQLRFYKQLGNPFNGTGFDPNLVTGISTNGQILDNYIRKTHATDPNLLANLFGDTKTKYFEYITFTIPTGYSIKNTGINLISYGVNSTGFFNNLNGNVLMPYENLTGTNLNNSDYLFTTIPIFSGDVSVRSSDTSRAIDKYTFILSGSGSYIDSIGRYTSP